MPSLTHPFNVGKKGSPRGFGAIPADSIPENFPFLPLRRNVVHFHPLHIRQAQRAILQHIGQGTVAIPLPVQQRSPNQRKLTG